MQISRHWRLNAQRYRLQGVKYENGETSLQNRPGIPSESGIGLFVKTVIDRAVQNVGDAVEGGRKKKESAA